MQVSVDLDGSGNVEHETGWHEPARGAYSGRPYQRAAALDGLPIGPGDAGNVVPVEEYREPLPHPVGKTCRNTLLVDQSNPIPACLTLDELLQPMMNG
ncbi:hypothetical protein QOZ99_004411 [Angulomicrobium amanitiforme]|uniref:Uncharacterized protein n=1 Tax=Ancylobacter amanitiformis TaxID=217069 RepID=A0ABU0LXS1_9HYPH|nr:hypothetical protein [Ancylobacter amanitiformis]MDQ0513489.1 hypothetical protein [Ancylobacter amanitiformis]